MRDMIGRAKFINLPVANETQNRYMRLVKMPDTLPRTSVDKVSEKLNKFDIDNIRTSYSRIWDGGSNG